MQREILVEIGPFKETQNIPGVAGTGNGLRFVSNGNVDTLKIQAHIEKTIAGAGNYAQVYIWNLNKETREALTTPGLEFRIYTRVDDGEYTLAFFGGLTGIYTERMNADLRTRIIGFSAMSNLYTLDANGSYAKGISIKQIVTELAQKIPGITIDETKINVDGVSGESGIITTGSVPEALTTLGKQFGFSWSIQDGVFIAQKDGTGENTAILLNGESGLIKVSPRFSGITQVQVGVDISSKYVEGLRPGQIVRVDSSVVSSNFNRDYIVHTLDCDLCPKTNDWNMNISFFYEDVDNG